MEGDVAAMADDLRADLDQLLAPASQRPRLRRLAQRQRPHEIPQVVGEGVKLRRTALPAKPWHDRRVHLIAPFPSLIHCSAVPR